MARLYEPPYIKGVANIQNRKKFKCKSKAQKKAIQANYVRMAEKVVGKGVRLGMTLSTYDEYLPHKDKLKENKKRPVVVIEKND